MFNCWKKEEEVIECTCIAMGANLSHLCFFATSLCFFATSVHFKSFPKIISKYLNSKERAHRAFKFEMLNSDSNYIMNMYSYYVLVVWATTTWCLPDPRLADVLPGSSRYLGFINLIEVWWNFNYLVVHDVRDKRHRKEGRLPTSFSQK
jgi:hypothetical protein